jgi:YesN/AraC family two-component response regulator
MVNKIKQMAPDVKIMFMSGYSEDIVLKHGINSGEVDFLQKPFTMDDVVRRISEVMQKRFMA